MAKEILEYKDEVRTYRTVVKSMTVCDRCGKNTRDNRDVFKSQCGVYNAFEFSCYHKTGNSYPEGGFGNIKEVNDLCDICIAYLFELLEHNGFTVDSREWDW